MRFIEHFLHYGIRIFVYIFPFENQTIKQSIALNYSTGSFRVRNTLLELVFFFFFRGNIVEKITMFSIRVEPSES